MTGSARHVIFGTGAIGLATCDALLRRGETVRMVNRSGAAAVPDQVEVVRGDASDPEFTTHAATGAAVVYQTLNPPYSRWVQDFPALQAGVLAAAHAHQARLVSMENVYLYGRPGGRPLDEARAYAAHTTKGKLRARMATDLLTAHQNGHVEVAIGRASDYLGPGGGAQSNLGDRLFPAVIVGKTASVLGDPDQPHTYTYIPDIGEGLTVLGAHPDAPGQVWHLPNDPDTRTTRQLAELAYQLAGTLPGRIRQVPPLLLRLIAVANPTVRDCWRCSTSSPSRSSSTAPRSPASSACRPPPSSKLSPPPSPPTGSPRQQLHTVDTETVREAPPHHPQLPFFAHLSEIRPRWSRRLPTVTRRIAMIVATSMAAGLLTAVVLVVLPFVPAEENVLTGAMLLGFAAGWVLLVVLSVQFSDQPQRWAAMPAAVMAVLGLASLSGSGPVHVVLGWVWPPVLLGLVIWMFLQARGTVRSRGARWLLYPVLAMLTIASVGGGYETVRESADARAYPMPGHLVDVGGHRLHLLCTGTGSPTVVLEPGQGGVSSDLAWIAPAVASDTTVCVYDRPGRGWSDAADEPQDGDQIAADLHTLLVRAHVPGPYMLAGHSFGGLYMLSFAAQFPDDVAGLVLLDSTAPKAGPALPTDTGSYRAVRRVSLVSSTVAHVGVGRWIAQSSYGSLPERSRGEARANASTAHHLASFIDEFAQANTAMQQASSLTSLDGKPLIVLTADEGNNDDRWQAKQDHLATLSTNALHRHADATHESLLDDEVDASTASQAIRDVVTAVRTGHPLS